MKKKWKTRWKQGFFKPANPNKYKGNVNNIIYRSSLELKVFRKLDKSPNILWWNSEEVIIPYRKPTDGGRIHRYFPDLLFKTIKNEIYLVEIKPYIQTKRPTITKRKRKSTILKENIDYSINKSKWYSAEKFCIKKGWHWKIITEKEINKMK